MSPMQIISWLMLGHWFFFFFLSKLCQGLRTTGKDDDEFSFWENILNIRVYFIRYFRGRKAGREWKKCLLLSWLVEFRSLMAVPLLWGILHSSNPWSYYTALILDLAFRKYNPTQAICYYFSKKFAHNPLVTSIF